MAKIANCKDTNNIEINSNKLLSECFFSAGECNNQDEIVELNNFGIHSFFDVKEVKPRRNIWGAVFMAVSSIFQVCVGIAFAIGGNISLGATLLIEGFKDGISSFKIAMGEHFNWNEYFTNKGMTIVITLVTIGAEKLLNKLSILKSDTELVVKAVEQSLSEVGKLVTEKAIQQELLKATLKEVVKRVVINSAIDKIADHAFDELLDNFTQDIKSQIEKGIRECLNETKTQVQLKYLFQMDEFNGNDNNYKALMSICVNNLKNKQNILVNIINQSIHHLSNSNSASASCWTKVAFQTIKFGQIAKAVADVDNLVSHMQDRLRLNIQSKYEKTKISFSDVLEKKCV